MDLLTFTSAAEVRAALGVNSTELPDATVLLPMYYTVATMAMEDVNSSIPTQFATIDALPSKTAVQQRFLDVTRLFVTYTTAKQLLTSAPLFSVKVLTDGKASFERQADPYAQLREDITGMWNAVRYRLNTYFASLSGSSAAARFTPMIAVASTLATDPVTGS